MREHVRRGYPAPFPRPHWLWPVALFFLTAMAAQAEDRPTVPEPHEFRTENYRATVPATLTGATMLTTRALQHLLRTDREVVLIDVLPAPRKPQTLAPGTLWRAPERNNIPGSVWLPNTGYGILPIEEEEYLRRHLQLLTRGDIGRPLVFYCLANCWMSWNAAKRAVSWGYKRVYWYPDGTDGWDAAGLPLASSKPEPQEGER